MWVFLMWNICKNVCDCIQTVANLNTNSHLPHKACDLITLIKCIGEEFWGSGYELVLLIAWLYCSRQALKWWCLILLTYTWGALIWSTRFIAWEKYSRGQLLPLTHSMFKLSLWLVTETIIWFDRQIGCY